MNESTPAFSAAEQSAQRLSAAWLLRMLQSVIWIAGALYSLRILTADRNDWSVIAYMLLFAGITGACWLFAMWVLLFRSALRSQAARLMFVSAGFLCVPLVVRNVLGEEISLSAFAVVGIAVLALAMLYALFRPRQAAGFVPAVLYRSRVLNLALLGLVALAWLVPIGTIIFVATEGVRGGGGSPGEGLAMLIIMISAIFIAVGCFSAFVAIWGWMGFRLQLADGHRTIHVVQMLSAAPGIVIGALLYMWLLSQASA